MKKTYNEFNSKNKVYNDFGEGHAKELPKKTAKVFNEFKSKIVLLPYVCYENNNEKTREIIEKIFKKISNILEEYKKADPNNSVVWHTKDVSMF